MASDTEEKILKDWNALNIGERHFDTFVELYRYLKGSAREQGMQNKKEIYKYKLPAIQRLSLDAQREIDARTKIKGQKFTTTLLAFRRRAKELKKGR